jgi:hypothetical protein
MPRQLLSAAPEEAERAEPAVKAAALLHIARVLHTFDRIEADRVLEEGIFVAGGLPEPDREVILSRRCRSRPRYLPRALSDCPLRRGGRAGGSQEQGSLRHDEPRPRRGGRRLPE